MLQSEGEVNMSRVILESFIFHATTSIPFQQTIKPPEPVEAALSLAETKLQEMYKWKVPVYPESPVLGAPPKLFVYAREIALMHERSSSEGIDIARCHELQQLLSHFSHCGVDQPQPSPESDWLAATTHTPLLLGPRLYIVVSKILLEHMINSNSATADSSLQELVCEGMSLVSKLDPSTDYYAEYYCWPMVVLGTYTTDDSHRDCLLSQAMAFWKATRNGTMRRLVDMLTTLW